MASAFTVCLLVSFRVTKHGIFFADGKMMERYWFSVEVMSAGVDVSNKIKLISDLCMLKLN